MTAALARCRDVANLALDVEDHFALGVSVVEFMAVVMNPRIALQPSASRGAGTCTGSGDAALLNGASEAGCPD